MSKRTQRLVIPLVLLSAGLLLIGSQLMGMFSLSGGGFAARPTITPEPLLPTKTPSPDEKTPSPDEVAADVAATPELEPTEPAVSVPKDESVGETDILIRDDIEFERFGVSCYIEDAMGAWEAGLRYTHLYDWKVHAEPEIPEGVTFWQMIRLTQNGVKTDWDDIFETLEARPGSTWIVGNEPDVIWQDNVTAETYAFIYHQVYTVIKEADPTARVAPAGVAEGSELRLRYLDRVLDTYEAEFGEPMPVDVWTLHAFNLREERGSWGVDIPPGFDDVDTGVLYEIEDHGSIEVFTDNIVRFRQWMVDRGYRNQPLVITEMGILFPNDYGFPDEFIGEYMHEMFDVLLSLEDETIGLPSDGNRLVQLWFWYIIEDLADYYPVGNLYNSGTGELTFLGETFMDYVAQQPE